MKLIKTVTVINLASDRRWGAAVSLERESGYLLCVITTLKYVAAVDSLNILNLLVNLCHCESTVQCAKNSFMC